MAASGGGKRRGRNKLGLALDLSDGAGGPEAPPPPKAPGGTPDALPNIQEQLAALNLAAAQDDEEAQQRARIKDFLFQKSQFLEQNEEEAKPDDFENLHMLGFGNGGSVWKVRHRNTGLVVARKMIHLEIKPEIQHRILRELRVLHECNSPEIVGFYGSFCTDGEINILMEFMDCGSLDLVLQRVGRIREGVVGHICLSVLKGLAYLRDVQKIIHRDVKPSNILVNTRGEIKLCDFGVSGELNNSLANTFVGTRSYMAPERLLGDKYAVESDLWSLGLSLVELATGRFPFPAEDLALPLVPIQEAAREVPEPKPKKPTMAIFELLAHIVEGEPPRLPQGRGFAADFESLVADCCQKDPQDRPGLPDLLQHPWMERMKQTPVDMAAWAKTTVVASEADPEGSARR